MSDQPPLPTRSLPGPSRIARRFVLASTAVFAAAFGGAYLLIRVRPLPQIPRDELVFPAAFWVSTALLYAGSLLLQRSLQHVRRERQPPFRRALGLALVAGTLFVGLQTYGLWGLVLRQDPSEAQTGVTAFVIAFVSMHGLHFTLALAFVVFVTVRALADRYDHEYYWGVTVCTWFWHALAAAWTAILLVFLIAR